MINRYIGIPYPECMFEAVSFVWNSLYRKESKTFPVSVNAMGVSVIVGLLLCHS